MREQLEPLLKRILRAANSADYEGRIFRCMNRDAFKAWQAAGEIMGEDRTDRSRIRSAEEYLRPFRGTVAMSSTTDEEIAKRAKHYDWVASGDRSCFDAGLGPLLTRWRDELRASCEAEGPAQASETSPPWSTVLPK